MKIVLPLIALVAMLAGCSKEAANEDPPAEAAREGAAAAGAASRGHAPADVEPGSHEDWCGEHGVPETQCTRCNPELTAAFKATGDWCAEHGLPESQCTICNPEIEIVRPPPADGNGE